MREADHRARIALPAGGVSGTCMVLGEAGSVSIIASIWNDEDCYMWHVCPDLGTRPRTPSGKVDPTQGPGVEGDPCRRSGRQRGLGGELSGALARRNPESVVHGFGQAGRYRVGADARRTSLGPTHS